MDKKSIQDMLADPQSNTQINIPLKVSKDVFANMGLDTSTSYIMDAKKMIFKLYGIPNPDLSIKNPRKTLAAQRPNKSYGIPINKDEIRTFMKLFSLNEADPFQAGIGGRIVRDILTGKVQ